MPSEMTGYSNEIDEGDIALGSWLSLENIATLSCLTGIDCHLPIRTFIYENIYQISAPIAPRNSGGAFISVDIQKMQSIQKKVVK